MSLLAVSVCLATEPYNTASLFGPPAASARLEWDRVADGFSNNAAKLIENG